ncbi:MAG: 16S rRNA (cytosine(967)-C(5))-methyltransferase RsmB [Gammaproteobacteria bacterium]
MNARQEAARVLYRVLQDDQSLTAALESFSPSPDSTRDQAFVQALCYGACRHFFRLDFILSRLLSKPLKDMEIKALALIGLYQLGYMRVKAHAAVSETVSAVPKKKAWARPLLNAVLRNYQRRQGELEHQAGRDPEASTEHPAWLIDRISKDWPGQAQAIFEENNKQAPMVLRVNSACNGRDAYLGLLNQAGIAADTLSECATAVALREAVSIDRLPGFTDGWVSVQDCAAQLAADLLAAEPNQRVLDVCSAPGGKAAHILETTPDATLVAVDISEQRIEKIKDNFKRLRLNTDLIVGDAARPGDWWDGRPFDRILLDAPCSATGVIRRHPDIKLLRRPEDIAPLQQLQQTILEAMWPILAPGGILLYATCSILKQENEANIETFLTAHQDADEWPIAASWGNAASVGRQILTGQAGMDGFYYARIRKQ